MTARRLSSARKNLLRFAIALTLNASSALVPISARAEASASDGATAQALFDGAKALMKRGNFSEACPKLEESQRIDARSGTALNLADCYEHVGRLATAWSTFLEAATLAKAAGNAARERGARDRAAALVPRLSTLLVNAPFAATTPGLRVTRDGVVVGEAQFGLPLPVDAGEHRVAATAMGRKPWQATVTVEPGASKANLDIPQLEQDAPAPAAKSAPASSNKPAFAEESPRPQASRVDGAVIAGGVVTGVFAVGAVLSGVLYKSKLNAYDAANKQDDNETDATTKRSQVKTLGIVNLALLGGAIAAAGVTVVLWATRSPDEPQASARLELRGTVLPGLTGLTLGGHL